MLILCIKPHCDWILSGSFTAIIWPLTERPNKCFWQAFELTTTVQIRVLTIEVFQPSTKLPHCVHTVCMYVLCRPNLHSPYWKVTLIYRKNWWRWLLQLLFSTPHLPNRSSFRPITALANFRLHIYLGVFRQIPNTWMFGNSFYCIYTSVGFMISSFTFTLNFLPSSVHNFVHYYLNLWAWSWLTRQ